MTCNYAIENQDKIAVIYHLNTMNVKRSQHQKKRFDTHYNYTVRYKRENVDIPYKEFVIINEKMIKWSYGTDDIKKEIPMYAPPMSFCHQIRKNKTPSRKQKNSCGHIKFQFHLRFNNIFTICRPTNYQDKNSLEHTLSKLIF